MAEKDCVVEFLPLAAEASYESVLATFPEMLLSRYVNAAHMRNDHINKLKASTPEQARLNWGGEHCRVWLVINGKIQWCLEE